MNEERRQPSDRRRRPTPMVSRYYLLGGRRRSVRRVGDSTAVYVDRIGQTVSILLLLIFFFHCLDAILTLDHLGRGGKELNPLMDYLIRHGTGTFVLAKLAMAAVGLWFLGVHKNFPFVRKGIAFLFILYAFVIGYQMLLMFRV